jgi:hypothetical protein
LPLAYNTHDEHVGYLPGQPGYNPLTTTSTTTVATTITPVPPAAKPASGFWRPIRKQCTWKACSRLLWEWVDSPEILTKAATVVAGDQGLSSNGSNRSNPHLIANGTQVALPKSSQADWNWGPYLTLLPPVVLVGGAAAYLYSRRNASNSPARPAALQPGAEAEVGMPLVPLPTPPISGFTPGASARGRANSV